MLHLHEQHSHVNCSKAPGISFNGITGKKKQPTFGGIVNFLINLISLQAPFEYHIMVCVFKLLT